MTTILIEHSNIYSISILEGKQTTYEVFLPMLHSTSVAFLSGTHKDANIFSGNL